METRYDSSFQRRLFLELILWVVFPYLLKQCGECYERKNIRWPMAFMVKQIHFLGGWPLPRWRVIIILGSWVGKKLKNGIRWFSYLIEAGLQTYVMLKMVQNTKYWLSTPHTLVEYCVNRDILNFLTLQCKCSFLLQNIYHSSDIVE